ncbi:LacI family transcriptional regulator [Carnobacterium divergens]|uniref:LacI family DNA-binding transcriptional regulator n=1 Tax=Carnobacterium divergens TaxID=2748 RepID=UPI000E73E726|nr:LacI family DNA-binding transcriptional regulator [Carnobacterium divergens]ANZ98622.1 LacI family transcriptional regulator [Carnobacterium divergens]MDT2012252.1 LacI family DNA-binding transcriptional regulator [Carnobacterium divergens]TFJ39698.1 LacI family transcriptional regulator [Carnobacterium divergens]TFJ48675.1 LacI family transcriptional regulator [Carnobacterium divergens]TFJ53435.1 LacI family transcriptional regulator [Carnobacterium divergens]
MTIKLTDVAKKAGVSPTTVSRVINHYGYLSQKTIDKVHLAMEELNYQPNSLARSLQGKNTQLIGLIFSSVGNPFFGELVEKLENKLFEKGYKTILCNSADNKEKERDYLRMLAANKVDGIIAGAHNLGIKEYEKVGLPIVSFDRFLADNIPIVSSDNFHGGQIATQALIQSGGEKIAIFTGTNRSNSPTNSRLEGYLATIKKNQLEPYVFEFDSHYSPALKSLEIKKILKEEALDSVFCTDDLTAILVMNEAVKLGLKVPEELKIIGYDGTTFMQQYFSQLTTIVQPIEDCATLLIDLLVQRITDKDVALEPLYTLPVKLIQGAST